MPYDEVRGGIAFGDWKLEGMARAGVAARWMPAGSGLAPSMSEVVSNAATWTLPDARDRAETALHSVYARFLRLTRDAQDVQMGGRAGLEVGKLNVGGGTAATATRRR
jgi:hypothetical protein